MAPDIGVGLILSFDNWSRTDVEESASYFAVVAGLSNTKMDLGISVNLPLLKKVETVNDNDIEDKWNGFG